MSDLQPAELGEVLGGYRLEAVIGRGGMGWVYEAVHVRLKRRAAVKVLATERASDRALVTRFMQEAKIASSIRHPNIVDVIDFVEQTTPPRIACVMELVDGPSLFEVLATRRLKIAQAINAAIQLASALEAVHKKGVTHRDLKPANILVLASLDGDFSKIPSVKICDFGIAKSQEMPAATTAGMMLGTPAYMSPEQIAGEPVGPETDLYALAELLAEMLTGSRVFDGPPNDILRAKLMQPPPQITLAPRIFGRDRLASLLRACLATERAQRPTLTDFKDALVDLREEFLAARPEAKIVIGDDDTDFVPREEDTAEWITAPPRELDDSLRPTPELDDSLEPPGDTVSDAAPVVTEPQVPVHGGFDEKINTGFFYNRIVEDVVKPAGKPGAEHARDTDLGSGKAGPPPPRVDRRFPGADDPGLDSLPDSSSDFDGAATDSGGDFAPNTILDLEVGAVEESAAVARGVAPARDKPRVIREARIKDAAPASSQPSPVAIIRGTPVEAAGSASSRGGSSPSGALRSIAFVVVGLLLAGGAAYVARARWSETKSVAPAPMSPLDLALEKHRKALGSVKGTPREHLERAFELMKQDRWASYESASAEIAAALLLDRSHAGAIGSWVENELSWREELLTAEERASLAALATKAEKMTSSEPSVLRASAMLAADPAQCLEQVGTLAEDRARAIALWCRARAGAPAAELGADLEALPGSERLRASALLLIGRPGTAAKLLEKRLKSDAKNSAVLRALAAAEKENGKLDPALAHLMEASSGEGWAVLARIDLGLLQLDLERWDDAASSFAAVISQVELSPSLRAAAYVGASRAELGRVRFDDAKKKASGALALLPKDAAAHEARAEAELEKRAFEEAIDAANQALAIDAKAVNAAIVALRVAAAAERADEVTKLAARAAAAGASDPRVLAIAFAARVSHEGAAAAEVLAGIAKHDPGERVFSTRARLGVSPGATLWAIEKLRRADEKAEVSAAANVALAVLYYGSGHRAEAGAAAERALAAAGQAGMERIALMYQAQIAWESGELAKAEKALQELLAREPDLAVAAALTRRIKRER